MNARVTTYAAFAVALSIAPFSGFSQFAISQQPDASASQTTAASQPGQREAARMVAAQASLPETLDAKKTQVGQAFTAKISNKVQLDHGPELPSGTILHGTVENDDMQQGGMSKLALRFETATLKDGTTLPIKATIVGVYSPGAGQWQAYPVRAGDQVPDNWNDGTLVVDQISVTRGVDLHSRIASKNSGVFVSKEKSNVTLRSGTELQLAIATAGGHSQDQGAGAASGGASEK